MKKIIITESTAKKLLRHELLMESDVKSIVSSKEFKDSLVKAIKSDSDIKKYTETEIKKIVAKCVSELFRTLWQRKSFWDDTIKNA